MHELSIAQSLVNLAREAIQEAFASEGEPPPHVAQVHLRVGRLAGIVQDALISVTISPRTVPCWQARNW